MFNRTTPLSKFLHPSPIKGVRHFRSKRRTITMSVQEYIDKHDLTGVVEQAINVTVKVKPDEPISFLVCCSPAFHFLMYCIRARIQLLVTEKVWTRLGQSMTGRLSYGALLKFQQFGVFLTIMYLCYLLVWDILGMRIVAKKLLSWPLVFVWYFGQILWCMKALGLTSDNLLWQIWDELLCGWNVQKWYTKLDWHTRIDCHWRN